MLLAQKVNKQIDYPLVEMTAGIGIIWLFQANVSVSPFQHFYIQPRFSITPFVVYEAGGVIGFQSRYRRNKIFRLGLGYSQGEISYLYLNNSDNKNEFFTSVYVRFGLLYNLKKGLIFNPNINITRFNKTPIISANFTLGYCLFR
jgi:hypothetical protein